MAVVWGEERGADLEWRLGDDAPWLPIDARPPRYGFFAATVHERARLQVRALPGAPRDARFILRASCGDPEMEALPHCLARLSDPDDSAPGNLCGALRLHAAASAASKRGAFLDAVALYAQASKAWSSRQDRVRAAAAQLGRAESLVRLGRYAEGERAAREAERANAAAGNPYFAARSRSEACVALRELGNRSGARTCLTELAPAFQAVGESGDAANTYASLASMANEDGDVDAAGSALVAAQKLDLRAAHVEVGARLAVLAGDFDLSAGRVAAALARFNEAAEVFERTRNDRWLGNVYLRLGGIYWALGARAEALAFAQNALERFPREHSPGRRADALRMAGQIHAAAGDREAAQRAFQEALDIVRTESAPIAALTLDLDLAMAGDGQALDRSTKAAAHSGATNRQRARLAAASAVRAQTQGNYDEVLQRSRWVRPELLDWSDRLRWRAAQADALARRDRMNDALDLLESDLYLLRERAASSRSAALQYVAGIRLQDVRAAWVDIYATVPPSKRPTVERVWRMLRDTQVASVVASADAATTSLTSTESADRALAAALLESPDSSSSGALSFEARRALMLYFARSGDAEPRSSATGAQPTLSEMQSTMPDGVVLLAFGFGRRASLAMSMERDRVDVRLVAPSQSVQEAASKLRDAVSAPDAPIARINDEAARLSTMLVGGDVPRLPDRLIVMTDALLEGVPLSLLTWPGQPYWLADTTPTSLMLTFPDEIDSKTRAPRAIQLVTAMGEGGGHPSLPALTAVGLESKAIAAALPQARVVAGEPSPDLLASLASPGAWIHVATHGISRPGLHGFSGLWLDGTTKGSPPRLFSWLDAMDRRSSAAVVVLNACSLASGDPRAASSSTSLAAALSASGAQHVVAAMWPISDTAGLTWAPAFYGALEREDSVDVGRALLTAQHRLRQVGHFRHPFFWASLVHFTR